MSTDEARSSSTSRRLCLTRSESVLIFMPASTLREHAGTRTRAPSSSTTQTRHTFTGVRVSSWHSVGVSIRMRRQASRMVDPSRAWTSRPSMVSVTSAIEDLQLRQAGGDRVGGGLAEAADRCVPHRLGNVAEKHHVGTAIPVRRLQHALEDLLLALGADAAGHALPAGLVAKEPRDPKEDLPHVRGVVEDMTAPEPSVAPIARVPSKLKGTSSWSGVMKDPAAAPSRT